MTTRKWIIAAVAASLAAGGAAAEANESEGRGEAELAQLLEGRSAGDPMRCIDDSERRSMRVVDGTALVFRSGDTLYVNRPAGARLLDWSDVPVFEVWGGRLCEKDRVQLRDSANLAPGPVLLMGEFVPYRREG